MVHRKAAHLHTWVILMMVNVPRFTAWSPEVRTALGIFLSTCWHPFRIPNSQRMLMTAAPVKYKINVNCT